MQPATQSVAYTETTIEGHFDPRGMLQQLIASGAVVDYLLYDEGTQVRVACNAHVHIAVREQQIAVTTFDATTTTPVSDPLQQVSALLQSLPIEGWRAYSFVSFDLCRFYYSYTKKPKGAVAQFMVPATELIFTMSRVLIRSLDPIEPFVDALGKPMGTVHAPPCSVLIPSGDQRTYCQRVHALVTAIRAGSLRKAILSRCVKIPGELDVLATHLAGSRHNAAVRSYAGEMGGVRAVGFSPEILMQSSAEGLIVTNPLAGTRPRGANPEEDQRLRAELFTDAKEVKEHALSVWLAQQEIDSVCMHSSTRIFDFMTVKPYRTVQHLSSRVSGLLARDKTPWDALRALFPGITVSGIGKREAVEWIDCLEDEARGLYAGAIGWIDSQGASDLAIAIRSAYQYGGSIHLNAGAGIVAESDPDHEFIESCNKMATMSSSIILNIGGPFP